MKKTWPLLRKLGMKDSKSYEKVFNIFHRLKDLETAFTGIKKGKFFSKESQDDHILKQLELMEELAGNEKLTMISGHRHRKDVQAMGNLLSISIGDWEHSEKTPTTAFHLPDGDTDRWVVAEYRREDDSMFNLDQVAGEGHWRVINEFIFNDDGNEWEEKIGDERTLKTLGEQEAEKEWNKYAVEGTEKLPEFREEDEGDILEIEQPYFRQNYNAKREES